MASVIFYKESDQQIPHLQETYVNWDKLENVTDPSWSSWVVGCSDVPVILEKDGACVIGKNGYYVVKAEVQIPGNFIGSARLCIMAWERQAYDSKNQIFDECYDVKSYSNLFVSSETQKKVTTMRTKTNGQIYLKSGSKVKLLVWFNNKSSDNTPLISAEKATKLEISR